MRADALANREALVTAARSLIAADGADVPLSTIAEEAGVGIATLYRHFPTREALHLAVVLDTRDRVMAVIEAHGPAQWQTPREGWPRFVHQLAALRLGPLVTELARTATAGPQHPTVAQVRADLLAAMGPVLGAARSAALVRADLTVIRFHLGLASITRPLPPVGIPELDDHIEWLTEVYINGLRPDA